ncbi:MAG: SMP-30/gluconolactonase/LRE family protein [Acidobacteriota bacterium]
MVRQSVTTVLLVLWTSAWWPAQDVPQLDLLIRNGRIVDGTGNPSTLGDVGISAGRIVAVGSLEGQSSRETIDARGLVIAPGFIDIHNHSDDTLLADGDAQSMIRQGVTTLVLGEGGSAAPSDRWPDFASYFAELLRQGIAPNVASYVGSSQVWTAVHGSRGGPVPPSETDRMRDLVREAMEQGALGVSSSLSGPPGSWIDTGTLVALCEVAARYGGIYSTHLRSEGLGVFQAAEEALEIGRRARIPVDIIHLKIADHQRWGQMPKLIELLAAARSSGQLVEAHVYPYRAGQNNLASIIPPWAHEGGRQAMIQRLQDSSLRKRLEREILNGIEGSDWYNHYTALGNWEGMLLVSLENPKYRRFQGKRMSEAIQALGKPPLDVLFELLMENGGSVPTVYFHHSEEDMRYALAQPFVSIGSDGTAVKTSGPLAAGHPHPRYYGTFPRVLGRYVREQKLVSLEEAVRKMTSANSAKVHLYDRGLLRPGQWADITIFNPETVMDRATFENPHQYAVGIEYVIVNGRTVLKRGEHTGARPGTVLYGQGVRMAGASTTPSVAAQARAAQTAPFTEGPAYHQDGSIYFTDVANNRILRLVAGGGGLQPEVFRFPSGRANGLAFDLQGRLLACEGGGQDGNRRVTRTEPDGSLTVLAERYQGKRLNSPNDLDIDSEGRIYFTDPRYGDRSGMELDREAVYRIDPGGGLTQIIADLERPNGLAVSPNQKTLYVIDNNNSRGGSRKVYAYALASNGSVGERRVVHDFGTGRGGDGMCLDRRGNLYVTAGLNVPTAAEPGPVKAGVYVFTPDGTQLDFIPVSEDAVTNCSFGDPDLKTLYITAGKTLFKVRRNVRGHLLWPAVKK